MFDTQSAPAFPRSSALYAQNTALSALDCDVVSMTVMALGDVEHKCAA